MQHPTAGHVAIMATVLSSPVNERFAASSTLHASRTDSHGVLTACSDKVMVSWTSTTSL